MSDQPAAPTGQNVYVQVAPQAGNGLAVASLVLGLLSLLFVWIPVIGMIAWILAPLGLVLGLIGLGKPTGRGMAIAGVICSAVGLIGCFAWLMLFGALAAASAGV